MRFAGAIADVDLSIEILKANRRAVLEGRQEGDAEAMRAEIEARAEAVRILRAAGGEHPSTPRLRRASRDAKVAEEGGAAR
ncbi:MAG: hypothetical protein KJ579_01400 [Verrucomicrobia bacterium]|nr:hypothetical protein [Verrucomicrobiota bacterium]